MKKGDIIIIAAVICAAAFLYFSGILSPGEKGGKAVVYIDGKKVQEISLDQEGEYTFETEDGGYNVLLIKDGKADMLEADCRDKICVNHSPIYRENESITCLPHKLVVEIEGGEKNDVDAVAG
jgi:hypothetical protein